MLSNDAPLRARDDYVERGNFGLALAAAAAARSPAAARHLRKLSGRHEQAAQSATQPCTIHVDRADACIVNAK
jgi:hypothetical protein